MQNAPINGHNGKTMDSMPHTKCGKLPPVPQDRKRRRTQSASSQDHNRQKSAACRHNHALQETADKPATASTSSMRSVIRTSGSRRQGSRTRSSGPSVSSLSRRTIGRRPGRQDYLLVPDFVFAMAVDVAPIEVALHLHPVTAGCRRNCGTPFCRRDHLRREMKNSPD